MTRKIERTITKVRDGKIVRDSKSGRFIEVVRGHTKGPMTSKASAISSAHTKTVSKKRGAALMRLVNR